MTSLLIRLMRSHERALVLSDWKRGLWDARPAWGKALPSTEWWALVNFVLDHVTLPSADVWMACHRSEEDVPIAWLAAREDGILFAHATRKVHEDPKLAAYIESSLRRHAGVEAVDWNPFLELKRPWPSSPSHA